MRRLFQKNTAALLVVSAVLGVSTVVTAAVIEDVSLGPNGQLQGYIRGSASNSLAGTTVHISQGSHLVATTKTTDDGSFRVAGLRGGSYQVKSNQGSQHFRCWASGTAPPVARATAELSSGGELDVQQSDQHVVNAIISRDTPEEGNPGGDANGDEDVLGYDPYRYEHRPASP